MNQIKIIMKETLKNRYDYYVKQLSLLRQMITNLSQRHVLFRNKCEACLITRLLNFRRLKNLRESMQDVYSSFDKLATKRTFLWGMISKAYQDDDQYINETFDQVYLDIDSFKEKLQGVDKFLRKLEKK